ncbi:hypothetical protein CIW83_09270 [Tissierella sp. P1]|uniref:phage antirepressor n=1 Tax=Tissierella sp. P1 TaxID=1280483 RepID=UPI000B9F9BAA|nr:phage antirepressor [Tissierella sp. P1]OZV12279.1 hypothetical protein CIW83_09270 [Tissierella sp. P1]
MNDLQIFKNEEFGEIRTVLIEGKPYFVGIDIARALGYSNPSKAIIQHCKGVTKMGIPSKGGIQETNVIPEGDIYRLITKSELPSAEKFETWVFDEVLPSIRKHGAYLTDGVMDQILSDPDFGIKLLMELKTEREEKQQLQLANQKQQQIIGELKPKADYTDKILKNKGLVTITQIAKDYGMSGTEMNKLLYQLKVQYKQSDQWLLYKEHHGKGYTHSETIDIVRSDGRADVKMNTKWTQKGRLFLYDLLKENGILPTIEKTA